MSIHCHEHENCVLYAHNAYWYYWELLTVEQAQE